MDKKLVSVRCPAEIITKSGKKVKCNHLCVKINAGSSGQIKCRHCGTVFNFYSDSTTDSILGVRTKIRTGN